MTNMRLRRVLYIAVYSPEAFIVGRYAYSLNTLRAEEYSPCYNLSLSNLIRISTPISNHKVFLTEIIKLLLELLREEDSAYTPIDEIGSNSLHGGIESGKHYTSVKNKVIIQTRHSTVTQHQIEDML